MAISGSFASAPDDEMSSSQNNTAWIHVEPQQSGLRILLSGAWRLAALDELRAALRDTLPQLKQTAHQQMEVDGAGLESLDTAGAWVLAQLVQQLHEQAPQAALRFHRMPPRTKEMLQTVMEQQAKPRERANKIGRLRRSMEKIGRSSTDAMNEAYDLFSFMGQTFVTLVRAIRKPGEHVRANAIIRHIGETGIDAIPIISLIAFLISIVLAYQGIQQLAKFGAEIFTVNMVSISVLREMGVLLTAIMIAGRSGSAFTAEIGVMQVNEEVDAMRVIGLDPFEMLVVPRFLALLITLPLLTFLADLMGLLGGMIVFKFTIGVTLVQYIDMIQHVVKAKDFWVGIGKAPVFALIISVVGCLKGMQVSGSAESVGRLTTASVVASIFIILLADAVFAVVLTKIGL